MRGLLGAFWELSGFDEVLSFSLTNILVRYEAFKWDERERRERERQSDERDFFKEISRRDCKIENLKLMREKNKN